MEREDEDEDNDEDEGSEYEDDEEEEEEDESDSDASDHSGSSSMRSHELVVKKPARNALVPGDDGEYAFAHEVGTYLPSRVDSRKVEVMRASLFETERERAALRAADEQVPRTFPRLSPQSLNRKHSRDSEGDGLHADPRERASFAHDVALVPQRPSRKYARVASSASAVAGSEGSFADAGLAMGRSFRVGWGPGGTLVHLGSLCAPSSQPSQSANSSVITLAKVPMTSSSEHSQLLSETLLSHHLSHTTVAPDDDDVPFANPRKSELKFSTFASLFAATDRTYEATLFRLGQALFDSLEERLGSSVPEVMCFRIANLHRKAALSSWLQEAVSPTVSASLAEGSPTDPKTSIVNAFTLLTGNQVEEACEEAMNAGFFNLATLISQAGGDDAFRADLQQQLQIWREQSIPVDVAVKRIYALLAGNEALGDGLDVTDGLDWKRVLGLHLWYFHPAGDSVTDVFREFRTLNLQHTPHYIEDIDSAAWTGVWSVRRDAPLPPDGMYQLIQLYADPAVSLSQALEPLSFSPSPLDVGLLWHLYIIMSRCLRQRDLADREEVQFTSEYSLEDDAEIEGHSPSADLLTSSYAHQLEGEGMVQEAAFVLLHVEGSAGRERAIRDLLVRSAPLLDEWMQRGLIGSLRLPHAWVDEARATYALYNDDMFGAYELYLSAGHRDPAHDIAVRHLAPDAILRRDYALLTELLEPFVGKPVESWQVRGKILMDYAHIMQRLPQLAAHHARDAVPDAVEALELEDLCRSVPKLLGLLPDVFRAREPRHRAALAEITAGLLGVVDRVRPATLAQVQSRFVEDGARLGHARSMAHDRFKRSLATVEIES
ncbi:nuclear protein 96-domain-containing protein [Schizophyllum amplum]|uniref:Nuclear protein 96-domain-containing protein n=1 Tax=Schizophyllum amplum TaxID=97359 RepID=A0A550CLT2_9AGAR|nr:nuclear protein 96-domain-containing protein [Auriculariopsis ampla]